VDHHLPSNLANFARSFKHDMEPLDIETVFNKDITSAQGHKKLWERKAKYGDLLQPANLHKQASRRFLLGAGQKR
ncbi:hypothetical protein BT69DRAFT_1276106, partial [Atractiella rhizophila]